MKMPEKSAGGFKQELIECGPSSAYLHMVVRYGKQEVTFGNDEPETKDMMIAIFELPDEIQEFNGEEKPRVINREFPFSNNEKSNLAKLVKAIDPASIEEDGCISADADPSDMVGEALTLDIGLNKKKTHNTVAGFSPMKSKAKEKLEDMYNEAVCVDLTDEDTTEDALRSVYPWILKNALTGGYGGKIGDCIEEYPHYELMVELVEEWEDERAARKAARDAKDGGSQSKPAATPAKEEPAEDDEPKKGKKDKKGKSKSDSDELY